MKMGFGSSSIEYNNKDVLETITTIFNQHIDSIENVSVQTEAVSDNDSSDFKHGISSEIETDVLTSSASRLDSAVEIQPTVEDLTDQISSIAANTSDLSHDTSHTLIEIESTNSIGVNESVPQESNPNSDVPAVQLEATGIATSVDGTEISTVSVSGSESVPDLQSKLDDFVEPVTPIDTNVLILEDRLQGNDLASNASVDSSVSSIEIVESENEPKESVAPESKSQLDLLEPTLELEARTNSFHDTGVPTSSELGLESEAEFQQIAIEGQLSSNETNIPSTMLTNDQFSIPSENNSVVVTETEGITGNDIGAKDELPPESINQIEPVIQHLDLEVTSNITMDPQEPEEETALEAFSVAESPVFDSESADILSSNTTQLQGEYDHNNSSLSSESSMLNKTIETAVQSPSFDQNVSLSSNETINSSISPGTDKPVEETVKPLRISVEDAAKIRIASPLMKMVEYSSYQFLLTPYYNFVLLVVNVVG